MINLLPPDLKQEYKFAKYNRTLLIWILAFGGVIGGIVLITIFGTIIMKNSADAYQVKIANTKSNLQSQNLEQVQAKETTISNNLTLMVKVLSKEVLFSELLNRLANLTPPKVILTNLTIAQNVKAVDLTAQAKDYNSAVQLQANLADPKNQVFDKSDIESINCAVGAQITNTKYPCTVSIKALFTKSNPFLFINFKPTSQ